MSDEGKLPDGRESTKEVKPITAYKHAIEAKQMARELQERVSNIENTLAKMTEILDSIASKLNATPTPISIQAQGIRPGQMIHNVIAEDEDGYTEEIICPTCGTREVRKVKVPTKIEIKEKPVIPDNYIPAPRSVTEFIELMESVRLPDGRTVFESDKFLQKLNEYLQKYGYTIQPVKGGKK